MPEIKNTFLQGKMNKDLDERLIPNGQYRDAKNVEVATSEGSDIGTVKNILGNKRVENLVGNNFKCVGSIADEKNNKLYWFISKYDKDVILEYDADNDIASYVLVDIYAGTQKAVLKFFGNVITGINIIDNLLFWTDNYGEPKKINIDTCKAGTTDVDTHTQLSFENGSFSGVTLENISPTADGNNFLENLKPKKGEYFWIARNPFVEMTGGITTTGVNVAEDGFGNNSFPAYFKVKHYRQGEFLGVKTLRYWGSTREEYLAVGITGFNGTIGRLHPPTGADDDFSYGDIFFGDNITVDITEKHVTVIKPKPLNSLSVTINHSENAQGTSKVPNLFETKFPRFSYRYKYRDGEFSAFAPFTEPVFNPKYTKDTSKSSDASIFYNQDTAYDIKEPYNKAMVNAIHSVDLTNFITPQTPEDVVEIDILYKQEDSSVIYSIDTIKHIDPEWHMQPNLEGTFVGYNEDSDAENYLAVGGLNKGKYIVTTENIYAALPANQLLRPWDNVPRKALAQEVTGNRIVYGNYLQNYNIGSKPKVQVSYSDRQNRLGTFDSKGLPSIKSQRNYQLGVVYCDKYGRETPVFTSNSGAVNIPWQDSGGKKNASKSTQLTVGAVNNFPEWVDSLKFFVKETSNEYYNLTMDRAWVTKSTYELDNSEGHLWISFPSSDRNKISEEDYIILKKKIGVGEEQISFENKFKVVDIKNEAPDAIKYHLISYGHVRNKVDATLSPTHYFAELFPNGHRRIDREVDTIHMDTAAWVERGDAGGITNIGAPLPPVLGQMPLEEDADNDSDIKTKDLYMSWSIVKNDGEVTSSKKYKIVSGNIRGSYYVLKLSTKISKIDADIAHKDGKTTNTTTVADDFKENLIFQIEKKELKDSEDFSGKFFVKISKNQISSVVETGKEVSNLDKYQVTAKQSVWYWEDDVASGSSPYNDIGTSSYGLTNFDGYDQNPQSVNHIHVPNSGSTYTDANGDNMGVTDWHHPWKEILGHVSNKTRFFVDAMHMAAGQSAASDYAKHCCIIWSGTTHRTDMEDHPYKWPNNSAWSYPPLKTWLSEFGNITNLIIPEEVIPGFTLPGAVPGFAGGWLEWPGLPDIVVPDVTIPAQATWYENNLISTSPYIDPNPDYDNLRVDGWVGSLQNVSRWVSKDSAGNLHNATIAANHINGLGGFITTTEDHTIGPRRWVSGLNGTDHGVGDDTKTYSDGSEENRHFMHLSFFAPGKDLHDGKWDEGNLNYSQDDGNNYSLLYGPEAFMGNLQGIWGGGVFTGETPDELFGYETDDADKHRHLAMEGNYDDENNFLPEPAAPGVGYGYDLDYRERHERQWDPTFLHDENGDFIGDRGNVIRDFIRNLYPGSRFRFNKANAPTVNLIDDAVYTIKKVTIKKLYNHTSWRKPYNRFIGSEGYVHTDAQHEAYYSVEQMAIKWLESLSDGDNGNDALIGKTNQDEGLMGKIVDFGAAHNRRLCYIIELDKNPTHMTGVSTMGNPLEYSSQNGMCGDLGNDNFTDVEFLDPIQDLLLSDLSKFPAIWEVDPKKQQVDLDIYYEASSNIPVRINEKTNELFAPIGCKVEIINATSQQAINDVYLESWDGNVATFSPGFNRGDGENEIDYTHTAFKFIREDGSYTVAEAGGQQLTGNPPSIEDLKTNFIFKEDIGSVIGAGLAWYNCFSFGNGLESNRIKDDFNEMFVSNGVKASTTIQETYEEERRSTGLIYSGIYNSNSGVNDLNQFIMAEKITKDLNPTYGSIQKLFQRRISLIAFCEDRVIQILANKDALFNADGNPQLISSSSVLGDANPFVGNYGISKNPESFASESYRAYFTDKARGAVLRLSKDGLTPISKAGMHDWFRDYLPIYTSLIGTYDSYKENYNITLSNTYTENIIFNTYFQQGVTSEPIEATQLSIIVNGGVYSGDNYNLSYNTRDVLLDIGTDSTSGTFGWGTWHDTFKSEIKVVNHPPIPEGHYQNASSGPGTPPAQVIAVETVVTEGFIADIPFEFAQYGISWILPQYVPEAQAGGYLHNSGGEAGQFYYWEKDTALQTFGTPREYDTDPNIYCEVRRSRNGDVLIEEAYSGTYTTTTDYMANFLPIAPFGQPYYQAFPGWLHASGNVGQKTDETGPIIFDRVQTTTPENTYVEFRHMGLDTGTDALDGKLLNEYYSYSGTPAKPNNSHSQIFNGDEIMVTVKYKTFATSLSNTTSHIHWQSASSGAEGVVTNGLWKRGYNFIKPFIQLCNGSNELDGTYITNPQDYQIGQSTFNPYLYKQFDDQASVAQSSGGWYGSNNNFGFQKGFQNSGYVEFPVTNNPSGSTFIPAGTNGSWFDTWDNEFDQEHAYHTISAKFKFTDGNTGADTTEQKVIDELWVRVGNANTTIGVDGTDYVAGIQSNTYPIGFEYPRFEIEEVKITKLFGVKAPHTAFVEGDVGVDVSYYDDPDTPGVDEAWTHLEVQAEGVWDPTVNNGDGGFVLNQDEINYWYNNTPQFAQNAIPSADHSQLIGNGFVEIQHVSNDNYNFAEVTAGITDFPGNQFLKSQDTDWFGNNRTATQVTINKMNQTTGLADGSAGTVTYWIPGDPPVSNYGNYSQAPQSYPFDKTINGITYDPGPGNANAQGSSGSSPAEGIYPSVESDYWRLKTDDSVNGAFKLDWPMGAGNGYETTGNPDPPWYLVDIEFDYDQTTHPSPDSGGTPPDIGDGTAGNGFVVVVGVAESNNNTGNGNIVDDRGVGVFAGSQTIRHIRLLPTWRTEYDANRWVLRAIYQVHPNSHATSYLDTFKLRFYNFHDETKFSKIVTRDITWTNGTGTADNWVRDFGNGLYDQHHTFTYSPMNLNSDKLCWDNISANSTWSQDFGSATPTPSNNGWTLNFTLGTNEPMGNHDGILGVAVTGEDDFGVDSNGNNIYTGMMCLGIADQGNYEIKFTMDGVVTGDWTIHNLSLPDPNDANLPLDYSGTADLDEYSTFGPANYGQGKNKVRFFKDPNSSAALSAGVNNISLTNQETIFQGGTVGSWNFDGFEPTIDQYIIWFGDSQDGRIQFTDCPTFDPNSTSSTPEPITANQYIDKPINRYEKYELSFTYKMESKEGNPGSGLLLMYYYNSAGYGFRVQDIGDPANPDILDTRVIDNSVDIGDGVRKVTMIVGIGDGSTQPDNYSGPWDTADSEVGFIGVEALRDTFVIRRDGTDDDFVTAWVDNVSLKRYYNIELNDPDGMPGTGDETQVYPETTLTFSENVNGWTSFKSFVPESGLSLSKKYFTLKDAALYQHYIPLTYDVSNEQWVDSTLENAENYNTFYGTHSPSTVKAVLNAEPSTVKIFNTLNYEGSQAHVTNPMQKLDFDGNPIITIHNAKAWSLSNPTNNEFPNIDGWRVTEIKTDIDGGSLKEFIKKEGKWFGYIRGKHVYPHALNISRFSVQGIGMASNITDYIPSITSTVTTGNGGGGGGSTTGGGGSTTGGGGY